MKKSLLAVAAIGAFASAAQAQSSVTVYGILDVGYVGGNTRTSSTSIAATTGNMGVRKTQTSQFGGVGAESTSRLGFKGVEDLGGGTSAFFTAEFALYPEDQILSGSGTTVGGLNNRQTFVGLKKSGIGQTAMGTQYTPVFNASAATSPTQHNNVLGDVVYAGTTLTSTTDSANGTYNASFTNRTSNTLSVQSDTFAGFKASAIYTLNNNNSTQGTASSTGGNVNASGWGLGADYTFNKFFASAAYQSLKQSTSANTNVALSQVWTSAQPSNTLDTAKNAVNVQDNQFLFGATYDFGILKAYAQYVNRKATSTENSGYYATRAAQQIGVRSFITPKIESWAAIGTGRYTAFGQGNPTANFNAWQLGTNYLLSKRTNLYAIYGQQNNSQAQGTTIAGTAFTGSSNANNYAVGVRHTF